MTFTEEEAPTITPPPSAWEKTTEGAYANLPPETQQRLRERGINVSEGQEPTTRKGNELVKHIAAMALRGAGVLQKTWAKESEKTTQAYATKMDSPKYERGKEIATGKGLSVDGLTWTGEYVPIPTYSKEQIAGLTEDQVADLTAYLMVEKGRANADKSVASAQKKLGMAEDFEPLLKDMQDVKKAIDDLAMSDPGLWTSAKNGNLGVVMDRLILRAAQTGDKRSVDEAMALRQQYQDLAAEKDTGIKRGKLSKWVHDAARMSLPMGTSALISKVPIVGQAISLGMWSEQGAGDILATLAEQGYDVTNPDAVATAMVGGLAYGLVEQLEVRQMFNMGGAGAGKALLGKITNRLLRMGVGRLLATGKEIGEEGVQKIVTNVVVDIIKEMQGGKTDKNAVAKFQRYVGDAWDEMAGAAGGMGITTFIFGMPGEYAEAKAESKARATEAAEQKTAEALGRTPEARAQKKELEAAVAAGAVGTRMEREAAVAKGRAERERALAEEKTPGAIAPTAPVAPTVQMPTVAPTTEGEKTVAKTVSLQPKRGTDVARAAIESDIPATPLVAGAIEGTVRIGKADVDTKEMDFLTELPNQSRTKGYIADVPETHVTVSIDADEFKSVNDEYSHKEGDKKLKDLGRLISEHFPEADFRGREGGEEFFVDLGETEITPELREKVVAFQHDASKRITVGPKKEPFTVSVGVGRGYLTDENGERVLASDHASMKAKRAGRNRVAFSVDKMATMEYTEGREIGKKGYVVSQNKQQVARRLNELVKSGDLDAGTIAPVIAGLQGVQAGERPAGVEVRAPAHGGEAGGAVQGGTEAAAAGVGEQSQKRDLTKQPTKPVEGGVAPTPAGTAPTTQAPAAKPAAGEGYLAGSLVAGHTLNTPARELKFTDPEVANKPIDEQRKLISAERRRLKQYVETATITGIERQKAKNLYRKLGKLLQRKELAEVGKAQRVAETAAKGVQKYVATGQATNAETRQIDSDVQEVLARVDDEELMHLLSGRYGVKAIAGAREAVRKGIKDGKAAVALREEVAGLLRLGRNPLEAVEEIKSDAGVEAKAEKQVAEAEGAAPTEEERRERARRLAPPVPPKGQAERREGGERRAPGQELQPAFQAKEGDGGRQRVEKPEIRGGEIGVQAGPEQPGARAAELVAQTGAAAGAGGGAALRVADLPNMASRTQMLVLWKKIRAGLNIPDLVPNDIRQVPLPDTAAYKQADLAVAAMGYRTMGIVVDYDRIAARRDERFRKQEGGEVLRKEYEKDHPLSNAGFNAFVLTRVFPKTVIFNAVGQPASMPVLVTAFHETGHLLQKENPKALAAFLKAVKEELSAAGIAHGRRTMDEAAIGLDRFSEEVGFDWLGYELTQSSGFWRRVYNRAPEAVQRFIDALIRVLDKVTATVRNPGDAWFRDVQRVRDAADEAMASVLRERAEGRAAQPGAEGEARAQQRDAGPFSVMYGTRSRGNKHEEFDTIEEAVVFAKGQSESADFVEIYDKDGNEVDTPQLQRRDIMQEDLFGAPKSVTQMEEESRRRAEQAEVRARQTERKGGEAPLAGLPMFEGSQVPGSQMTLFQRRPGKKKAVDKTATKRYTISTIRARDFEGMRLDEIADAVHKVFGGISDERFDKLADEATPESEREAFWFEMGMRYQANVHHAANQRDLGELDALLRKVRLAYKRAQAEWSTRSLPDASRTTLLSKAKWYQDLSVEAEAEDIGPEAVRVALGYRPIEKYDDPVQREAINRAIAQAPGELLHSMRTGRPMSENAAKLNEHIRKRLLGAVAPGPSTTPTLTRGGIEPAVQQMALFQRRTRLNAVYSDAVSRKPTLIQRMLGNEKSLSKRASSFAAEAFAPISTEIQKIDESLKYGKRGGIRKLEFDYGNAVMSDSRAVVPWLTKYQKMSAADKRVLDLALKNSDAEKVDELAKKYDMVKEWGAVRAVLDDIYARATDVGFDFGYLENYYPRVVLNSEGLIEYVRQSPVWGRIEAELKDAEAKAGRKLSEAEQAAMINNLIMRPEFHMEKPGAAQERTIDMIGTELDKFYDYSPSALLDYIQKMNHAIEMRRFFGKEAQSNPLAVNIDKGIGDYLARVMEERTLTPKQQDDLLGMLKARFNYMPTSGAVKVVKDLGYITAMGSGFSSFITQLADMGWAFYEGDVQSVPALYQAVRGKSKITKEDLGVDRIADEFRTTRGLGRAVQKTFKYTLLEKFDNLGKETLINSALRKYQLRAKGGSQTLLDELRRTFGPEAESVMADLKAGNTTENVKYLLFNKLLDYQPIALSEMPRKYLDSPNGRIFYALKTFTIKQLDVFRREGIWKIANAKTKAEKIKALGNLMYMVGLFVAANTATDWLKDWLFGRKSDPEDRVIDNIFRLIGLSRYITWEVRKNGVAVALAKIVAPPMDIAEAPVHDAVSIGRLIAGGREDEIKVRNLETWKLVPFIGKHYYWWFGGGREKERRAEERREREHIPRMQKMLVRPRDWRDRVVFEGWWRGLSKEEKEKFKADVKKAGKDFAKEHEQVKASIDNQRTTFAKQKAKARTELKDKPSELKRRLEQIDREKEAFKQLKAKLMPSAAATAPEPEAAPTR